jgi:membrane protein YqaA with SNARE-associated domain
MPMNFDPGWLGPEAGLASIALSAFLAATLLPLSSEAALFAVLKLHPELLWPALGTATRANTAGGMTTYLIGRLIGHRRPLTRLDTMRRWGAPALLLAWLPVIGDGLVVAAGWLKINWIAAAAFQALGRFARYWLVAHSALI